jgi:hypothetical protein
VPLGSIGSDQLCLFGLYFSHRTCMGLALPRCRGKLFLATGGFSVALDCALIGVFGGLFIVPLRADPAAQWREPSRAHNCLQQHHERRLHGARGAPLAIGWLEVLHFTIPQLFILAAVLNAVVATHTYTRWCPSS